MPFDVIDLSQNLIRCPSVTPHEGGALDLLQSVLSEIGFTCERWKFSAANTPDVDNLYARLGTVAPHFCFAGHTDVVPIGEMQAWSVNPFEAVIKDGILYGRGAADMKSAIAAFVVAVQDFLAKNGQPQGSISFLITGDEEGPAINGTKKMLEFLSERGEKIDFCLVGEPTNPQHLGEMLKIGRRGSLNGWLTVNGKQGHVAYPERAQNPLPVLIKMLNALIETPLDTGNAFFQPSNLEITSIDTGNTTTNLIPEKATAMFNIRFNNEHSGASLQQWLQKTFNSFTTEYTLEIKISGESFLTPTGSFSDTIATVIEEVTGKKPDFSTTGGTSDARFIKEYCPVIEFGIVGATMHKIDEHVKIADILALKEIYQKILERIFKA